MLKNYQVGELSDRETSGLKKLKTSEASQLY